MAKKQAVVYMCRSCGSSQQRWSGRCPECQEWGTLEEQQALQLSTGKRTSGERGTVLKTTRASEVRTQSEKERISTQDVQLDQVLGGGLVHGAVVLLAGQPGIGKSTLLLQLADSVASTRRVLYVSGEESTSQVALRAQRLKKRATHLELVSTTVTDDIVQTIAQEQFDLVVVDSIQTIGCRDVPSTPGTVSQITNSTNVLTQAAKQTNTTLIIVGHVTKDGAIAGPKLLEHIVDVVLQFEGDRYGGFKMVRPIKNRFGSTQESAMYLMNDSGLVAVDNPSAALLEERQNTDGSVVLAIMEGTRPLLVEVQALVNQTSYGYPKRTASGFDLNRLNLLIAVMERRGGVSLSSKDVYVNIVGGIQADETAADLAVCLAIASAAKAKPLNGNYVVFGEVGLSGEVRFVPHTDKRLAEALKLNFAGVICPKLRVKGNGSFHEISNVADAIKKFIG